MVKGLSETPYHQRLLTLGIPTLEYRRLISDMIQAYTIINKIDIVNWDIFEFRTTNRTRGNSHKLLKKPVRLNTKNTFSNGITENRNSLPAHVVIAPNY